MIPEFTDSEIDTIRQGLARHYQKDVEIHLAHSEILLSPDDADLVNCPTVIWHQRNANFVITKVAALVFRTQFYYTPLEQFDTGKGDYSDLGQCVTAVLQTQSDHERPE